MYTHQAIEILKTLSEKELMWFGKFLNSPYFNSRGRIIKLLQVLKRFYPGFEGRNFTKENLHKLVFGRIKYNDSTFRNLMADLFQLAQQYLKQEGFEKNKIESSFFLTQELFSRGLYTQYKSKMKATDILLKERSMDSEYFLNRYRINTDNFYVNLLTEKVLKKNLVISESGNLVNGIVSLLNYFVLESLKHNDNLLKYSRTYNIQKNIDKVSEFLKILNFEKLISYITDNSLEDVPVIKVYYNLLKAFTYFEEEKYYKEFKKSLFQYSSQIGINDNNHLYARLMDYSILKKNLGLPSGINLNQEIFELNQIYIKNEYYKTESNYYIPFDIYRNVLINCIVLKKLHEMEDFIKNYSKKLLPNHITSIENYSYALLFFEKRQYSKALSYLNKIKFDQFVYKLDMKNLELKISYELEEFESAISIIDTYKHFLKNNTLISESRRIHHNNFVTYTHQLIQYRTGSQKVSLSFIKERIKKSNIIFDKEWLLEKLKKLLSDRKGSIKLKKLKGLS